MLVALLVTLYFLVGGLAAVAGPTGSEIRDEYRWALATAGVSKVKAIAYRTAPSAVVLLLWPVLVPSAAMERRRRRKPTLLELIEALGKGCTDQNRIPGAIERKGATSNDAIDRPIDVYEVRNQAGVFLTTLYVSPYHRKNFALAPTGFRLVDPIGESETRAA